MRSAFGANSVEYGLVRRKRESVVGKKMVFKIVYEAAVYTYGSFAFRTFYMEMLRVAVLAESVRGAFPLFAYESGECSAFYKVIECSVYRRL